MFAREFPACDKLFIACPQKGSLNSLSIMATMSCLLSLLADESMIVKSFAPPRWIPISKTLTLFVSPLFPGALLFAHGIL